ncbi:DNA binding domain, excisionase family [Gottschalkia purinilytica]|uniref:DNA binding domain, excisionase family n=1 Tax=Gottschalkia purinilytica TaxID=1503 RepID=A0A0L0WEI8_GOTPU|nr:helix-turn-helix domain-containing protein [Gottschalkia purinilytica]KNF09851.1 DNA binding domain, excisionase family [Gottschalkia purinilytica]
MNSKVNDIIKNSNKEIVRMTMTAKEAAKYLDISYWLILELVKRKEIPCIDLGNRKLFRKHSLDAWMNKKEQESIEHEESEYEIKRIF